jgi:DNA primase
LRRREGARGLLDLASPPDRNVAAQPPLSSTLRRSASIRSTTLERSSFSLGASMVLPATLRLKVRLETRGLATFCKKTGGRGLHVVTPLLVKEKDRLGWDETKAFAQAICSAMAGDSPNRYLLNMSKKQRTGRIFLDYLRNGRMSTAVAPLSPRMRPGAPVSMPLPWSQVLSPFATTVLHHAHSTWTAHQKQAMARLRRC